MKTFCAFIFWFLGIAVAAHGGDDFLDRLDDALTLSAFDDHARAHLSGTLDFEVYHFNLPSPGVIDSTQTTLFNPRLTLNLDTQIGPQLYAFAQARVDRGFDPSDRGPDLRLDEYALRWTPWSDGRLGFQIGKFATVVGNWNARHTSWENPFIDAPLAYENVTGLEDIAAPTSARALAERFTPAEKYEYNPIVWGPSYTSGASMAGTLGRFDYAAEIKNGALSSRPETWDVTQRGFSHPTISTRIGFRPSEAWNLGLSASRGAYFRPEAGSTLPPGRSIGDYHEFVLAQDFSYAWRHWQLWGEFYEARFQVPRIGNADVFSYYLEAKYKITPQLFGALRWNQQLYSTVRDDLGGGGRIAWGENVARIDAALGYRFTAHTQLKLQYNLGVDESSRHGFSHTLAAQFTLRF